MKLLIFSHPQNPTEFFHTSKRLNGGGYSFTGWCKFAKDITTSTEVLYEDVFYQVTDIDEVRNHAGTFADPKDKENTFFKIRVKRKEFKTSEEVDEKILLARKEVSERLQKYRH